MIVSFIDTSLIEVQPQNVVLQKNFHIPPQRLRDWLAPVNRSTLNVSSSVLTKDEWDDLVGWLYLAIVLYASK